MLHLFVGHAQPWQTTNGSWQVQGFSFACICARPRECNYVKVIVKRCQDMLNYNVTIVKTDICFDKSLNINGQKRSHVLGFTL